MIRFVFPMILIAPRVHKYNLDNYPTGYRLRSFRLDLGYAFSTFSAVGRYAQNLPLL